MPRTFAAALITCLFCQAVRSAEPSARESQSYDLTPGAALACERMDVTLEAGGKVMLTSGGKTELLPMSVVANLRYDQRRQPGQKSREPRWVRKYDKATAAIKVDKGGQQSVLGENRRMIMADGSSGRTELFSPAGPLTREELDLLDVQGTGIDLAELLPNKAMQLGKAWKHSSELLAALLGLDAVSFSDVESMLGDVKQDVAHITGGGAVSGAVGGINTEIEVKLKYDFDIKTRRITWLALLIKEKRGVGHVGPGLDIVAKVLVKSAPVQATADLSDDKLQQLAGKFKPDLKQLAFVPPKADFELRYDRAWFVTAADADRTVMRFVDKGELLAQCNVAKVPTQAADKDLTLVDYQAEVKEALGKNFGQFVNSSETQDKEGRRVYRVIASGEASKLPMHWIYYLITSAAGQRVALAFTVESELVERFGTADHVLATNLRFNPPAAATAVKSSQTAAKKPSAAKK